MNPSDAPKKVYVETLGCQMNKNDSELMLGLLSEEGFVPTEDKTQADLVILNTCQIRANAEDKAYSYLGSYKKLKRANPHVKIAMAGCVAQQNKDEVFDRLPFVDLVFGTQNIQDLPELVRRTFEDGKRHVLAVDRQKDKSTYEYFDTVAPVRESTCSAWVTIIEGCDYFCTYCVVPYTRGRQISRPPQSVLDEVKKLADEGYKEVILLGQTVDAYGKDFTDRTYGLGHLLEDIHEQVPHLARIRFMTSHPLDINDHIIEAIATLPRVMEYIHMPMQAGSNDVLERMRRGYTREQYFDLIDKIRDRIPNVAISGDFIVGFPGETPEQFLESVDAVRRVRFDSSNTAVYSSRKQTPAGIWEDRGEGVVSDEEKAIRLKILNDALGEESYKNNLKYENQVVEVLVEGNSRRAKFAHRWTGRTPHNKVVNFDTPWTDQDLIGQILPVHIDEARPWALQGTHQVPSLV